MYVILIHVYLLRRRTSYLSHICRMRKCSCFDASWLGKPDYNRNRSCQWHGIREYLSPVVSLTGPLGRGGHDLTKLSVRSDWLPASRHHPRWLGSLRTYDRVAGSLHSKPTTDSDTDYRVAPTTPILAHYFFSSVQWFSFRQKIPNNIYMRFLQSNSSNP